MHLQYSTKRPGADERKKSSRKSRQNLKPYWSRTSEGNALNRHLHDTLKLFHELKDVAVVSTVDMAKTKKCISRHLSARRARCFSLEGPQPICGRYKNPRPCIISAMGAAKHYHKLAHGWHIDYRLRCAVK